MATAAKKEEVNPFVVVLLILAFAVAIGGGLGHDGGGGDKGGGSSSRDPCEGKNAEHVVDRWITSGPSRGDHGPRAVIVRLRCEVPGGGFRHVKARHMNEDTDWRDVTECIARTLDRGAYDQQATRRGVQDVYRRKFGNSGRVATVRVQARTGDLLTAFAGGPSDWARCAGR